MFCGIVEAIGTVAGVQPSQTGRRIRIATPLAREITAYGGWRSFLSASI